MTKYKGEKKYYNRHEVIKNQKVHINTTEIERKHAKIPSSINCKMIRVRLVEQVESFANLISLLTSGESLR